MINKNSLEQLQSLEKQLNYTFNNIDFLIEALTHPSIRQIDSYIKNYERLEFLGDAILGFLVTEMIFRKHTGLEEGNLAKIKAYVVSSKIIAKVASTINLADYLIMTTGEEMSGGRSNPNNIENSMEAILGAIFLDSNIQSVQKIVSILWRSYIENINFSSADPKTYLQELLQKQKLNVPHYELVTQEGPVHSPLFTVKVSINNNFKIGKGKSIKEAEKHAARKLLKFLELEENS